MKVSKLISLDIEVMERLREEPNASGLINELLLKHYKSSRLRQLNDEDRKKVVDLAKKGKAIEEELKKYGF